MAERSKGGAACLREFVLEEESVAEFSAEAESQLIEMQMLGVESEGIPFPALGIEAQSRGVDQVLPAQGL